MSEHQPERDMQRPMDGNGNERLGRLETSVENLHNEFTDIRGTLREIQSALGRSRETNWSVIFAGIAVAGSLYAAAIRPLAQDIERQTAEKAVIAQAVLTQTERVSRAENSMARLDAVVSTLQEANKELKDHGLAGADRRLSLLEYRLDHGLDGKPKQ